jgi:hypothetical protein
MLPSIMPKFGVDYFQEYSFVEGSIIAILMHNQ